MRRRLAFPILALAGHGTNDGDFQPAELAHLIGTALGELENPFKKSTNNDKADFRFTRRHERLGGECVSWFCLTGAIANGAVSSSFCAQGR